jgi:hypothetical protein
MVCFVTGACRKWRVELLLLADGSVVAAGECEDAVRRSLMAVEHKPSELLHTLEEWLAPFEEGEITILVRSAEVPIITWTTRSAGMALYWTAVVLGKAWPPSAGSLHPLAEPSLRHLMPRAFVPGAFTTSTRNN